MMFVLVGCESSAKQPPPPATGSGSGLAIAAGGGGSASAPVTAASTPTMYTMLCAICHGPEAKGYAADHAPSLVSPTFLESATDDFLYAAIANGRPGTAMAAYAKTMSGPLDDAQIKEIIAWLRKLGPAPKTLLAAGNGDKTRGAVVYDQNCKSCHGDNKARGEGISLANSAFHKTATASFVQYAIEHGRPGTKMDSWQGKLTSGQIDDVTAYIFDGLGTFDTIPEQQLPAPTGKEPLVLNPKGANPKFTPRSDACPPTDPKCVPNNRYVPMAQVADALAKKQKIIIIDARPESEWMRVHAEGAVSIPYHDMKRLSEIKNDGTWVIAYCACPHHLSGVVVDELRKRGIKTSAILDEGILEWHRAGYPVVAAPGVLPPPAQTPDSPGALR
jgi:mono/diheme cytochrome c family protein/rhodanese-related sulfurtransferase